VQISYSQEPKPLGTAGGLKLAEKKLRKYFVLIYGDSFLPLDYGKLGEFFLKSGRSGVIVVYDNRLCDTRVINNIQLGHEGRILKYRKDRLEPDLNYVEAGVMVFQKKITACIPANKVVSLEEEIFPLLIKKRELCGYVSHEPFYDIGTPKRLARFARVLRTGKFFKT
jgi:N-acetyl-alpha-D-muramate 1-phosphate uridylyltransferase